MRIVYTHTSVYRQVGSDLFDNYYIYSIYHTTYTYTILTTILTTNTTYTIVYYIAYYVYYASYSILVYSMYDVHTHIYILH